MNLNTRFQPSAPSYKQGKDSSLSGIDLSLANKSFLKQKADFKTRGAGPVDSFSQAPHPNSLSIFKINSPKNTGFDSLKQFYSPMNPHHPLPGSFSSEK